MSQTRRGSSESTKSGSSAQKGRRSRSLRKDLYNSFKDGFSWDKYLQQCGLPAAPIECFKQSKEDKPLKNSFKIDQKLEAQDPRNQSSICLATVIALQGLRILLRLDGSDGCNDFWKLIDSGDIYPLGTHEKKDVLLQPPLGFTKNVSTWPSFLARRRKQAESVPEEFFMPEPESPDKNLFEIGMKLEAVDKKNPDLICPATIGDIKNDQVFISFDGWRGAMDYWCDYNSRDLFPVHWCSENDHALQNPGNKGDNPLVTAKLKILAEESKRQTRSTVNLESDTAKVLGTTKALEPRPTTPKPRGRPLKNKMVVFTAQVSVKKNTRHKKKKVEVEEEVAEVPPEPLDESSSDSCSSSSSSGCDSSSEDEEGANNHIRLKTMAELGSLGQRSRINDEDSSNSEAETESKSEKRTKKRRKNKDEEEKSPEGSKQKRARTNDNDLEENKNDKGKEKTSTPKPEAKKLSKTFSGESKPEFPVPGSPFCQETSPSSFFGSNREEIVRKATVGWPSHFLTGGSEKFVTSDNKLGKFGCDKQTTSPKSSNEEQANGNENEPQNDNEVDAETTETNNTLSVDNDEPGSDAAVRVKSESSCIIEDVRIKSEKHSPTIDETETPSTVLENPSTPLTLTFERTELPKPRKRPKNPRIWSTHDVMYYIQEQDEMLASYAYLFLMHVLALLTYTIPVINDWKQEVEPGMLHRLINFLKDCPYEIDGEALLLLTSVMAVKFMGLKLGPALKLANLIEKLKQQSYTSSR